MNVLTFVLTTIFSFYMIYKAIRALDLIYNLKNNGLRKQARVIKIREEKSSSIDDDYGSSTSYYYTVSFKDKNGREIEKEIEFGVDKKPKRNPPFSIGIIYNIDDHKNINIILENSKKTIFNGYILLFIGLGFLGVLIYNYDSQIDKILDLINKIFK